MIFITFLPVLFFVSLYVGSGIYFSLLGIDNAFYQVSPTIAIIPAIALGWMLYKGTSEQRMRKFIDGVRHPDIITMCIIFLLAGAFSSVTTSIGSVDSTVNLALSLISPQFLLIGIFITAAFISMAIGSSMGTIATIAPIAASLAARGAFSPVIGMATVVGGAMFGDSLSPISDTTIAAVMSQEADMKKKLRVNAFVAVIAAAITVGILLFINDAHALVEAGTYSLILVLPYVLLIVLAVMGVNVFMVLLFSILCAWFVGNIQSGYTIFALSNDMMKGFLSMHEIMVLSMMVGGLSGLVSKGSEQLTTKLSNWISTIGGKQKTAQYIIGAIVSVFDLLLANNTVAIVFSGEIARDIAKRYEIPPHYSAAWLDIFSCVFQGIIPYGAQLLLAGTIAGISPLVIMPHVYYCYIMGAVACVTIFMNNKLV